MRIWVDADACPAAVKEILFRAADRARVPVTLVSNMALRIPASPYIKTVRVPKGFNVADKHIAELVEPGDLVIPRGWRSSCALPRRASTKRSPPCARTRDASSIR
jgi:uncharacterized protein YaiI (UPF0178 family)